MPEMNLHTTMVPSLSDEVKEFYSKQLIELAGPELVHDQFGSKRPIPEGNGTTVEFRKFDNLAKATTPLTEGVTPDGNKLHVGKVNATVDQYGDYVALSDKLDLVAIDPIIVEANKKLSQQAGMTLDTVTREILVGGTNKMFAPKKDGSEVMLRESVTEDCELTVPVIRKAATKLKRQNAPKIGDSYVAIVHPDVACDLMASEEWIEAHKYAQPENIYNGEIGKIAGVRFVESTEAKILGPAEIVKGASRMTLRTALDSSGSTTVAVDEAISAEQANAANAAITADASAIKIYVGGKEATVTKVNPGAAGAASLTVSAAVKSVEKGALVCGYGAGADGTAIYCTLFIGDGAYGTVDINGGGLKFIFKNFGSGGTSDPLDQRATCGWKAMKTAVRLVEQYMVRVEHASPTFSAVAESN